MRLGHLAEPRTLSGPRTAFVWAQDMCLNLAWHLSGPGATSSWPGGNVCLSSGHLSDRACLLSPEQYLSEPGGGLVMADKITLESQLWCVAENRVYARLMSLLSFLPGKGSSVECLSLPPSVGPLACLLWTPQGTAKAYIPRTPGKRS